MLALLQHATSGFWTFCGDAILLFIVIDGITTIAQTLIVALGRR